jgi:hypothetical protein
VCVCFVGAGNGTLTSLGSLQAQCMLFIFKIYLFSCALVFCLQLCQCEGARFPGTGTTDICVLPCGCWDLNPVALEKQLVLLTAEPSLQPLHSIFFFFFKDLFIICKYTEAVFRHSRRGRQISLRMVVSHHVVAGIWTPDLRKSSRVLLPTEPSHQPQYFFFFFETRLLNEKWSSPFLGQLGPVSLCPIALAYRCMPLCLFFYTVLRIWTWVLMLTEWAVSPAPGPQLWWEGTV